MRDVFSLKIDGVSRIFCGLRYLRLDIMIEIVSATRASKYEFWNSSALGISLKRVLLDERITSSIYYKNTRGLSDIYNERILSSDSSDILVFIHDDVWIDDELFIDGVIEGCEQYDIIGVAGNRRRVSKQWAWGFVGDNLQSDTSGSLSGSIRHGKQPHGKLVVFGHAPAECELLDGVFLAAKKSTLNAHDVKFDSRFDFHFYDLDFCRTARKKGLRLGTWPIAFTHQSEGAFNSPSWVEKKRLYRSKWLN